MTSAPSDLPFHRSLRGPNGRTVDIRVGVPFRREGVDAWICLYRIDGLGDTVTYESFGVDAIQALVLALAYVSNTLYTSDEYREGELAWHAGLSGDLGLPTTRIIADSLRERGIRLGVE